jgi:transcription elongation factor Elf1
VKSPARTFVLEKLHRAMEVYSAWFDAQIQGVAHNVAQVNES